MKKEYIMSIEDKELKRIKIELNRKKRKLKTSVDKASSGDEVELQSKKSVRVKEEWSPGSTTSQSESSMNMDTDEFKASDTPTDITPAVAAIVEAITKEPNEASQVIQNFMRTQSEALQIMSKIIQEPSQALILISHLIKNPADGMFIIGKMISSPLDALSVFTQFMAHPTDALQIIFKIMSSPKDVLQFMTELTKSPQNALEIMKGFLSTPAEALSSINRMMGESCEKKCESNCESHDDMIKSMLEVSSVDSPNSSVASPSSAFNNSIRTPNSPVLHLNDFDANNNDYQNTSQLLNEISHDINQKFAPFQANSIDSIINEAIKLEYETPQMISQMRSPHRELNEVELMKIQELIDSNKALYAPVDEDLSSLMVGDCSVKAEPGVDPMLLRVINLTAVAIRRLIKMSKKISGFKKMCQEDQIALLKGGCTGKIRLNFLIYG